MKFVHFILSCLAALILGACQSTDADFLMRQAQTSSGIKATQITEDVNSNELNNILTGIFGHKSDSRSLNYHVTLLNDSTGKPAVIVVNYPDENGWAIISASKDHYPVLAYNYEGQFQMGDLKPQLLVYGLTILSETLRTPVFSPLTH